MGKKRIMRTAEESVRSSNAQRLDAKTGVLNAQELMANALRAKLEGKNG